MGIIRSSNSGLSRAALRRCARRIATALLTAGALQAGCGGDEPDPPLTPTPGGAVTADASAGPGTPPASPGGAAPSGTPNTPGTGATPTNPTGGGTSGTPTPTLDAGVSGGGGGSVDTQWCKVKAVLDKNCTACHKTPAVGGAPFPLTSHAELIAAHPSKQGQKVHERVAFRVHADKSQGEGLGVMPPGKPLSAADIALIDAWSAAGAPAGANPTCTPPAGSGAPDAGAPTATQWPPKECDAVYKITSHGAGGIDTANSVPAGRESHPQVAWDAPWGDEQVQAIAFRSITDNAAVLHHWILSARPGGMIFGWAPGEEEIQGMPDDVGMMMPTGKGTLNLDMHYYNTNGTKTEADKSGVEVCVVKKEHFRKNHAGIATRLVAFFSIPPNAVNYEAKSSCTFSGTTPITLLNASPHAHKLATRMIFTLKKKNGQVITMHDGPFMFGEQGTYPLDPPVVVENGDVINTTCVFNNKSNRTVGFGESTEDEMCFNFAMYYPTGGLTCVGAGGLLGGGM